MSETFRWISSWFVNTLSWWQWLILAAIPLGIIALYFLKLKRRPVEVPSTYLWHKSIEDLHANTIWQRLRRNLLLLLQLLLLLLVALALLRPSWQTRRLSGQRFVFLIDTSASMQASDVAPSRLEEAKRQVGELIDQMESEDVAMIVSFSDVARVEQEFTNDRHLLRRRLRQIRPTPRRTMIREALEVASGLANPGRSGEDDSDVQVAEARPADLYIFSDGKFPPVSEFSLGYLRPIFVPIGHPDAKNLAIVSFAVRPQENDRERYQAFARLENYGQENVSALVELFRDDNPQAVDADQLQVPAGQSAGVQFDLGTVASGVLRLEVSAGGDLALDDQAWCVIRPPRRAHVLLITAGNQPLELALRTSAVAELADVRVETPGYLKTDTYRDAAATGLYDLVIYDRCTPLPASPGQPAPMPQANTMFIGSLPPASTGWSAGPKVDLPEIYDVEAAHPLLQWIYLAEITVLEGRPLRPPPGGGVLVDSDQGPLMAIAPRQRFEDLVLGFPLLRGAGATGGAGPQVATNWMTKESFPVFVFNLVDYFGRVPGGEDSQGLLPGDPLTVENPSAEAALQVRTPDNRRCDLQATEGGKSTFLATSELGVYDILSGGKVIRQHTVNLFSSTESNIPVEPRPKIKIGYVEVEGQSNWEAARTEIWKALLVLGLVVLLVEWYIYHRRVYR